MANYANLLANIAANIKAGNGVNATTGYDVETALDAMVASLGAGYQFMGVATPATTPGNTDVKQFYIAAEPGTYTNFLDSGSVPLEVADGELSFFKYSTAWSKDVIFADALVAPSLVALLGNTFAKDWKLNPAMTFNSYGVLEGNSVPTDNTAMSFYKGERNVWWMKAKFNRRSGDNINSGFVLGETINCKVFRLMKLGIRPSGGNNSTVDLYSHPNGSFIETKRVYESTDIQGDSVTARFALSGSVGQAYLNDIFLGHRVFYRINGKSGTMFGGILMSRDNSVESIEFGKRPTPYAHFSLDDVGKIMKTIAEDSTLTSIFDNEMFAFLKDMHEKYGLCITLNLFYSIIDNGVSWDLSSFPATFRTELLANSAWLKFGFHGGDESIRYTDPANNTAATTAYANFVTQVARFATEANIDYMPRVTYFSGNKTLWGLLNATGQFNGCLTADDTRIDNSGLDATERDCINASSDYIDFENGLYFVRSSTRFDTQTTAEVVDMVKAEIDDNGRNRVFEYFTHAVNTISTKDRASIEEALKILSAQGIRMDFAMNNMPF